MSQPDVLTEALRAEGLDAAAIERVNAALAAKHLSVMTPYWVQDRLNREAAAQERKRSRTKELAAAIPYAGVVVDCQAQVWETGRGASAHRCLKNARFVVRRKSEFSGHRDRKDRPFDERLAVCRTHAEDVHSRRYHGHWPYEKCADEMVEPEYQPDV